MEVIRSQIMPSDVEEDPYAISSDSESEEIKKPPPKIQIGERSGQLNQLKTALTEKKQSGKDAERLKEIEDLKANNEAKNIKKGFETGKVSVSENAEMAAREKAERDEEKQRIAQASKENYSKFKDKFERLDSTLEENLEEKLKRMEKEQIGLGKDGLASAVNRFEKGNDEDGNIQKEKVEITRSEADRKRIMNAFHGGEIPMDDGPQDCVLCQKRVYPVERMIANRSIYHKNCFRCATCNKKLLATNYGSHEGKLLCKGHLWEALHPGAAIPADDLDSEDGSASDSGDEEFAVTNKPRKVNKNIVKSGGMDISDELSQLRSLKEKKGEFETSVKNAEAIEKKSGIEEEIAAGKVKENMGRFVNGANEETKIKREELHFDQVGDIKNKWKTGQVETAEQKEARETEDLQALRGSINVKERFKERTEGDSEAVVERSYDASQLNTSSAAEARKSFMEGRAFESSGSIKKETADDIISGKAKDFKEKFEKGQGDINEVQKTQVEIDGISLDHLKSAFEAKGRSTVNMTPEERAEQKQKEIEAEFLRYKLARKAATKRAQQMAETGEEEAHVIGGADTASGVGVGGIRDTFNSGRAFNNNEPGKDGSGLDVEVKVAGKARAKFQQLDTNAQPVLPKEQRREPSKWDKKETALGDVVNRRDQQDDESEEEEYDVKNLMNKFKNIGENDSNKAINSEQRAELEKIRVQAKNLKQQFEQGQEEDHDAEEYRKKEMEVEFDRLKRERAAMQQRLQEERDLEERERAQDKDEDVGIKAEHASKMAAKWEKIHQKEARKAEKSRMPTKGGQDH
ncbi:unnamed protein product, partial [Mesorhabditis belari]|uniref:LIM zinc-binding domain-containing protein n=1 Tax=Mesorhabditis belari TaxID=2138241 RepID=A0AAF3FGM0_9BILA